MTDVTGGISLLVYFVAFFTYFVAKDILEYIILELYLILLIDNMDSLPHGGEHTLKLVTLSSQYVISSFLVR
ncbi:MAG: hypothetical protein JRJ14_01750, partial [Deltaproteobacteria bacterium]|nr:hypothetical protein [Deltaproteobacteria bacterium]